MLKQEKLRCEKKEDHGTHNGAKSVVHELMSEEFPRIRVGIGKPVDEDDAIDYVIGKLDDEKYEELRQGIDKAVNAAVEYIKNGIDSSMNRYN